MQENLWLILVGSILVNNFVMSRFYGTCPFLGVSKKTETALGMGMAVTFVMVLATAVTWPIYTYLLYPNGLSYLQTIVFILVVAVTRYVSLGSLILVVLFLAEVIVYGQMGGFSLAQPELYEVDENGEKIPDSDKDCALSNWEKWTYESAVVNETVTVPLDFFENKRGDVDGNGKIEATDLAMLRKILLGVEACQNEYTANANGDSDIDLRDLICLKKNLLA